jgi:hypothetical protein
MLAGIADLDPTSTAHRQAFAETRDIPGDETVAGQRRALHRRLAGVAAKVDVAGRSAELRGDRREFVGGVEKRRQIAGKFHPVDCIDRRGTSQVPQLTDPLCATRKSVEGGREQSMLGCRR